MSKKIIFIAVFLIILFSIFFLRKKTETLVNPLVKPAVTAQPSPTLEIKQPKEIQYDSATDLKKELESIDLQVLDSDFE